MANLNVFEGWDAPNILGCNCNQGVKTQKEAAEKYRTSYQQSKKNLLSRESQISPKKFTQDRLQSVMTENTKWSKKNT